jgi:hypothetical protein
VSGSVRAANGPAGARISQLAGARISQLAGALVRLHHAADAKRYMLVPDVERGSRGGSEASSRTTTP